MQTDDQGLLQAYRPHILYAFPSYLLDLIAAAERHGTALPRIATLYTSSEVLKPQVVVWVTALVRTSDSGV